MTKRKQCTPKNMQNETPQTNQKVKAKISGIFTLLFVAVVIYILRLSPFFYWSSNLLIWFFGIAKLLQYFRPNSYPEYFDYRINKEWIKPGDHIYVHGRIRLLRKLYYHHGIYLGFGSVADFGAQNKTHPVISDLDTFIGSRVKIYKRDYGDNEIPVPLTVAIARALYVKKKWTTYKLFWNNCEHFCSILKMGRQFSDQTYFILFRKLTPLKKFFDKNSHKYLQQNFAAITNES